MAESGRERNHGDGWFSARDLTAPGETRVGRLRLFCLPHAGSGAAGFYRWKRLLAPRGMDVCPVLLPGREVRLADPPVTDAARVAQALVAAAGPWLGEPYALFGHSMGALLAYRWAVAIRDAGLPAPRCLFVSGRNAPLAENSHRELHLLPDQEFLRQLSLRYGTGPEGLMDDPEFRALFLPILRADLQLVETYRHPEDGRLSCSVTALAGVDDRSVTQEGLAAWGEQTSGSFAVLRVAGDHFGQFGAGQTQILERIAGSVPLLEP